MSLIKGKAKEFSNSKKSINGYGFFGSIISVIAFSTYYFFEDIIFASLLVAIAILITLASSKKPKIKKYEINDKNFYIENGLIKIPFKNIESYNIDQFNMKILLNTKNKLQPLISVPFEKNQNIKKIDQFLSQKIKKDKKLKISIPELIINRIIGF